MNPNHVVRDCVKKLLTNAQSCGSGHSAHLEVVENVSKLRTVGKLCKIQIMAKRFCMA